MAGSIEGMRKILEEKKHMLRSLKRHHLEMYRKRFWWDKAEKMFGALSSASEEEQKTAERFMRKSLFS